MAKCNKCAAPYSLGISDLAYPLFIGLTSNEKCSKCGNGIMKPLRLISSNEKQCTSRRLCDVCNLSVDEPGENFIPSAWQA